jgi:ubiquinone/menaquinone biosynthesis C-methylase UbiE
VTERDPVSARRDVARFDRRADRYDRSFLQRRLFEPVHKALGHGMDPVIRGRILDLGCGTGTLTLALAQRSNRAIGVDPAPRMVGKAVAKRANAPASFAVAEAESLPFADASFDGATASFTLHHWRDPELGLGELRRVLKPGGRVAIAEVNLPGPVRWLLRLVRNPHAGWDRRGLADLLYRSGFSSVQTMARSPVGPMIAIVTAER